MIWDPNLSIKSRKNGDSRFVQSSLRLYMSKQIYQKKYRLVSSSIYNANLFENMNLPVLFGMLFWHPIQQDLQTTPQKIPSQIFTYQNFVQNNSPNQNAARPAKPGRIRCINIPCHFSSISSKLLFPSHRSLMTLPLGLTTNVVFFGFRVDVFGGA